MKRVVILILACVALTTGQVLAQDANVITLNDSNPSVSAVIDMPMDTTGVVTIDLNMAIATLTDASGKVVFTSVDSRVHHIELNIVPNSGSHMLTVQRLPGAALASAQIGSQADLTPISLVTFVDTNAISLEQQHTLSLDATQPTGQVVLDIQPDTTGMVTARFPGAVATSQLTDASGVLIATSSHDIDAFNMIIDGGRYDLSVQASQLSGSVTAGVSVTPSDFFTPLSAPQAQTPVQGAQPLDSSACTATVVSGSVNLRSGPGTGYSLLDSGAQGQQYPVGGVNPQQNWVVVGTSGGSAWVSRDLTQLNGDCAQLQVFDIPLRNAQAAPVIVQTVPNSSSGSVMSGSYEDDDRFEDDHEGDDSSEHQESGGEHERSGEDD